MELNKLAIELGMLLQKHTLMLSTAESCTGGWIAKVITDIPGSSAWFERGFVTYTNLAKQEMLNVNPQTLISYGAVSEQVAQEMAEGVLASSKAQVSLAVTGVAGPTGGTKDKPVGLVCFGWSGELFDTYTESCMYKGDRELIRRQAVIHAMTGLLETINTAT